MLRRLKAAAAPLVKRGLSDVAEISGMYRLAARRSGGVGVILMLHRVVPAGRPNVYGRYMIDDVALDRLLHHTRRLGWEIVSLDEVRRRLVEGDFRGRFACFTSDDGYRDNLEVALPIFRKHGAPLTLSICTGVLDRSLFYWWGGLEELVLTREQIEYSPPGEPGTRTLWARTWQEKCRAYDLLDDLCHATGAAPARDLFERYNIDPYALLDRDALTVEQARQVAADPLVTIGAHGVTHERLCRLGDEEARREIVDGRRLLEERLGVAVRHLAYPFGNVDACGPREFAMAEEAGFEMALTTRQGNLRPEHRDALWSLPRRVVPDGLMGLRNALSGFEDVLLRRAGFPVPE
jgi:peptidoglycan/xylan/chitin deacetylase (PgdA/CDA1 family)